MFLIDLLLDALQWLLHARPSWGLLLLFFLVLGVVLVLWLL